MSKTDEAGALGLAVGNMSLAEIIEAWRTQRAIAETMGHIVQRSAIPDTASIIPEKPPAMSEPPAANRSGWAKENPLEPPLGEATLRRLDEITDAIIGPAVPRAKPKK